MNREAPGGPGRGGSRVAGLPGVVGLGAEVGDLLQPPPAWAFVGPGRAPTVSIIPFQGLDWSQSE